MTLYASDADGSLTFNTEKKLKADEALYGISKPSREVYIRFEYTGIKEHPRVVHV